MVCVSGCIHTLNTTEGTSQTAACMSLQHACTIAHVNRHNKNAQSEKAGTYCWHILVIVLHIRDHSNIPTAKQESRFFNTLVWACLKTESRSRVIIMLASSANLCGPECVAASCPADCSSTMQTYWIEKWRQLVSWHSSQSPTLMKLLGDEFPESCICTLACQHKMNSLNHVF